MSVKDTSATIRPIYFIAAFSVLAAIANLIVLSSSQVQTAAAQEEEQFPRNQSFSVLTQQPFS